jgi:CheY-like chemotaxis protein
VIEPQVLDLNERVQALGTMVRRLIGERIEVELRLGAGVPLVRADGSELDRLLMNLVLNARDAMPEGGSLRIETAACREADAAGSRTTPWVRLTVEDTGAGMSEETLAHAFEPFFTTKQVGKGSGLGLATCYGIATEAGGRIEVRSQPGRGTAVEVWLPGAAASAADADSPAPQPAPEGRETILLVEDDPKIRQVAAAGLRALGYRAIEAADGEAVSALLREPGLEPIDLVVSDMVMPREDGRSVVACGSAALKRQPASNGPHGPVLRSLSTSVATGAGRSYGLAGPGAGHSPRRSRRSATSPTKAGAARAAEPPVTSSSSTRRSLPS